MDSNIKPDINDICQGDQIKHEKEMEKEMKVVKRKGRLIQK